MKYLISLILISLILIMAPAAAILIFSLIKTAITEPGIKVKKIKLKGWY